MQAGDQIRFRFEADAVSEGVDKDAVGRVLIAEEFPAHPRMVEVEFGNEKLWGFRSESRFVLVDPNG